MRALVVFTRFPNDPDPGNPSLDFNGWPREARMPDFAEALLAPSPHPPYSDSTLTAYFHRQSLGHFVLFGAVYDSVLVALHPESAYHAPASGYGDLARELLTRIDSLGFDYGPYDYNRDGRLDHVFLIIRGDTQRDAKKFVWTGASCLDGRCAGAPSRRTAQAELVLDGVRVDWDLSGSILLHRTPGNILPHPYHVRLMAHELGHDLWAPFFVHIPGFTRNDVPATSNRSRQGHCIGYVLMAGAGGAFDCGGHQILSAFERDLLGWIDCPALAGDHSGIRLGDLYTTDACFSIPLPDDRLLYLTHHQRLGPFDQYRRGGRRGEFEMGLLRTTGLLVTLRDGIRLDVVPADNTLDLGVENQVYAGDLFTPETMRQLTPWTRPNSNGYTRYRTDTPLRWHAIDHIRYEDEAKTDIVFDYVEDFRRRPVIRAESWMGAESSGLTFPEGLSVRERATLHIEAAMTLEGPLTVDPGATLYVAKGALLTVGPAGSLRLAPGATLVVQGEIHLEGPLQAAAGSKVRREGAGKLSARMR